MILLVLLLLDCFDLHETISPTILDEKTANTCRHVTLHYLRYTCKQQVIIGTHLLQLGWSPDIQ